MMLRGFAAALVAACIGLGAAGTASAARTGLRRARRAGQQDLDPAVDVRRVHRLRDRCGDDRADADGVPAPQRDGLPQRGAVHVERPVRERLPRAARRVRAEGLGPARRRRHAGRTRRTSTRSWPTTRRSGSSTSAPAPPRSSRRSTPPRRSGSRTPSTWTSSARVARKAGQTLMVHNHDIEFETVFGDQTVYDILMANTDPRNVVFQLDLYWATNGGGIGEPARGDRALRQPHPALPCQGHGGRAVPGPRSRSSARGSSTSRRSSPRPVAARGTTSSSTTRASAIPPSTRSRQPRRASTTSPA